MDAIMQLDRVVRVGGLPVPAGCHQQKPLHVANGWFHNELDQTTLIKNISLSSKLLEGQLQTGVQPASKSGILTADTSTDFILRRKLRGERPQFGHLRKCCCLKPLEGGLPNMSTMMTKRRCDCYDLYDKCVPYMDAWTWQRAMVEKNIATIQEGSDVNDAIVILQHSPVYTMGTRSSEEFLLFDKEQPPCDFYRTERGGEVTYHGPGQLVMYPILNLRHYQMDLHWYLRSLEEVVIRALRSACAIEATRIKGITGVWVGNEKVAAIGVRVSRWVTYHGLALNVTTDLSPFKRIVPCGISTRPVGSVHEILHRQSRPQTGEDLSSMSTEELLDLLHRNLLHEFSEVFGLELSYAKKDLSILSANSYT